MQERTKGQTEWRRWCANCDLARAWGYGFVASSRSATAVTYGLAA